MKKIEKEYMKTIPFTVASKKHHHQQMLARRQGIWNPHTLLVRM
jgi:hypothetical protein